MPSDRDIAFPRLTKVQIDALRLRGQIRDVKTGDVLFVEGQRGFSLYIVLAGAVEIVEHSSGVPQTVVVHEPQEFTGDVDMLTGRVALVMARVSRDGQVLELPSRRCVRPDTHRLCDFASRNGIPFKFLDLETDERAEALLREFNVPPSATPVVIGREGQYHLNPTLAQMAHCAGLDAVIDPKEVHDLVVVGAGPAGLAAAVYAASEGLDVLTGISGLISCETRWSRLRSSAPASRFPGVAPWSGFRYPRHHA